ncbi:MAG TPA: hypothetical protein VJ571_03355 [Candidatus Nitrosotalea sp.]|nr:hypothetical protein [Candidatus Nitrosotalea sp.]
MKTPHLSIMVTLGIAVCSMMLLPHANATVPLTIITIQGGANSPSCGNSCITPQNITVDRGTEVQWINNDLVPHFIVSGNSGENNTGSLFNSGSIFIGNNFIHDFNDVGVFHYFDPTHTWDTGTINVTNDTFLVSSFQSTPANSQSNEELVKKLASARDTIASLMINGTGDIPFNEVGVIEKNMTLEVGIDSTKATLSEEQYLEKIKAIVGDIPIKITFGVINPTANMTGSSEGNSFSKLILSPLKQLKSGINAKSIQCKEDWALVFKADDNLPACVQYKTAVMLIRSGWAQNQPILLNIVESLLYPDTTSITVNGNNFTSTIPIKRGETKQIDVLVVHKLPMALAGATLQTNMTVENYYPCNYPNSTIYCLQKNIIMKLSDTTITSQKDVLLTITVPDNMTTGEYPYQIITETTIHTSHYVKTKTIEEYPMEFNLQIK